MAAANFTPIVLYNTATANLVPNGANLVSGELAINRLDEKLYFKNSAGTVRLLASSTAASGTAVGSTLYLNSLYGAFNF